MLGPGNSWQIVTKRDIMNSGNLLTTASRITKGLLLLEKGGETMNQSVQVGLVFPRSGQKLSVNISRQQADILDATGREHVSRTEIEPSSMRSHSLPNQENPVRPQ